MKENQIVYIPVDKIVPHVDNPRRDLGDLTELAESIKARGVMQNLTVVPCPARGEGMYAVIIGHRRLMASKLAGIAEVPCVIAEMTPEEQLATMLLENIQRVDLKPHEQAQVHGVAHEHLHHHPDGDIQLTLVSSVYAYALGDAHHHLHDGHALRLCAMDIKV